MPPLPAPLRRLLTAYRSTGADLPGGDLLPAHGVAMEGYFWRFTDVPAGRTLIALVGINRGPGGRWATVGLAGSDGFLRTAALPDAWADPAGLGIRVGDVVAADTRTLRIDLGHDARLAIRLDEAVGWPYRLFGGSSGFQSVPALNQYWHPWLLGGSASGVALLGDREWRLERVQAYGEKNWGREGFPDLWWWGQAQGFAQADACVAFAGGEVRAGPLRTRVTALVVRLPGGHVLRLGNPVTSPVHATVGQGRWELAGRGQGWRVRVEACGPYDGAHVLPVPLPGRGRNVPGAVEHLSGGLQVQVNRHGRPVWSGRSLLAGLEEGGLELAAEQMRRRRAPAQAEGAPPLVP